MVVGAGDHDLARLDRLAQGFQHSARKLGKLVHEQHAIVGQRHLPRFGATPAANDCGHRRRMVRFAERAIHRDTTGIQQPGKGVDHGRLQSLHCRQRWQNAGQPRGQHGLARPWGADHQEMVSPCCGHFHGPFGAFLSLHIPQVRRAGPPRNLPCLGRFQRDLTGVVTDHIAQRGGSDHPCCIDPRGFGPRPGGAKQAAILFSSGHRGGQSAQNRDQRAIEGQLAKGHCPLNRVFGQDAQGRQKGQCDGKVEMRPLLGQICRRQVYGDPLGRQRNGHGRKRRADPVAGF